MPTHISTISPATRAIIRAHITQSEGAIPWPYLDSNGNLTIGIGFHVPKKSEFANLPLSIRKKGQWVSANIQEKNDAFDQMMAEKKSRGGNLNQNAYSYQTITKVQMARSAQNAKLDGIITTNVGRIINAVGAKAWNGLTDPQKAAVTDIAHPFGGLQKFPNLKRAIISGNAKNMAAESLFFTDRKTRARDKPRLIRNLQALLNIKETAAKAELGNMLRDIDDQQAEDVGAPVGPGKTPPAPANPSDADAEFLGASLGSDAGTGKRAAARWRAPKVEEGLALGRFAKVARNVQAGRASGNIGPHVRETFGPLFRSSNKPTPKTPKTGIEEDGALQATINDLGRDALGQNEYKPVREDG